MNPSDFIINHSQRHLKTQRWNTFPYLESHSYRSHNLHHLSLWFCLPWCQWCENIFEINGMLTESFHGSIHSLWFTLQPPIRLLKGPNSNQKGQNIYFALKRDWEMSVNDICQILLTSSTIHKSALMMGLDSDEGNACAHSYYDCCLIRKCAAFDLTETTHPVPGSLFKKFSQTKNPWATCIPLNRWRVISCMSEKKKTKRKNAVWIGSIHFNKVSCSLTSLLL